MDPPVRPFHTVIEPDRRLPIQLAPNERIVAIPAPDAFRRIEQVLAPEPDLPDVLRDIHKLVDGDQLVAAEIDRIDDTALHDRGRTHQAIVNKHETARLEPVAPDFDFVAIRALRLDDLAANGG